MRNCPKCGAKYAIGDAICANCGAELPAPYEAWNEPEPSEEPMIEGDEYVAEGQVPTGEAADALFASLGAVATTPGRTLLSGAAVYVGDGFLEPATVVVKEGRIVEILDGAVDNPNDGSYYFDLSGSILAPGFIDVHVHGMMGLDTNRASADDFRRIAVAAAMHGTTALVPTTLACPPAELASIFANLRSVRAGGTRGARLLGTHLESNFISMEFKGAQPAEQIFSPNDPQAAEVLRLLEEYAADIRIMTVAPEVPGVLQLIPWLRQRGIIASIGHSAATYDQAIAGIDAGATHATHLFNAMTPLHHRNPGVVGAALERDEVYCEIVCDGVHVHPAVVSVAITAKGPERLMPISDALQGAGLEEGEFMFGGQHVTVRDGVARLDSGTIAGSITTMDRILRFLVQRVGWDLGEALMMVSTTPADGLNLPILGRIAPGAAADLVVLSQNLDVEMTFVAGTAVYAKE